MKSKYPTARLKRLYFWFTINFFLLGFGSILVSDGVKEIQRAIIISSRGTITLIVNIFINLILLKYFNYHKIQKNVKKKISFVTSSFIINLILYLLIAFVASVFFHENSNIYVYLFTAFVSLLINTLLLFLQSYMLMYDQKTKVDLENSKLKAANSDASNQLLRQQIHPHFLFNSLNTLKSLYKVDICSGEKYLIHLSAFLRAAVSKNATKVIPLKEELKLCEDYIEMQKIRFGDTFTFSVLISDKALNNGYVPSFSIQPLVENAIKHNEQTEESPLNIQIKQLGDRIIVINNLKSKRTAEISTGSGLTNLAERYRLLSNDDIIIDQKEKTFSVSIKILDHENSNN